MSPRAVLIALISVAVLTVLGFYVEVLYYSGGGFNSGVPSSGPFAALFLLTAVSGLLGRWRRGLRRRELLAAFIIATAGAPMVSYGILAYMLPHAIYIQYAGRVRPEWQSTFLGLVPDWFSPTQPFAVETFFQGGERVPWALWWIPLAAWCSFLLALIVASCCLTLLFQRQWISNERLSFPLAQIPLGLVAESPGGIGRLPLARIFWVGFIISFGLEGWNALSVAIPALPSVPLGPVPLMTPVTTGPMAALGEMSLVLWPWLVAVAYLIPKELSFSCWFFWGLRILLAFIAIAAGAPPRSPEGWLGDPTFPAFAYQGFGAILALSIWALWRARRHLARALRIAFTRDSGRADAAEPLPYRWALVGLLLSFGWMVYFCLLIGARLPVAIGLIVLILMYYLMWTWLRAETGLGLLLYPLFIEDMTFSLGTALFRPQDIIAIMSVRWTYFPGSGSTVQVISGNMLEGMKIADAVHLRVRRLMAPMLVGIVLAIIIGVYLTLTGYYYHGFYAVRASGSSWLASQINWGASAIYAALSDSTHLDLRAVAGVGAGAAIAIALGALRLKFWWWPLHPVGFLAAHSWGMHWYYMPFLIGWLAKSLVTRYGGLKLYRETVPFAVGLVAGDLLNQVVWALIRAALRGQI